MIKQFALSLVLLVWTPIAAYAADYPTAKPEAAGFSQEGLEKLQAHFQGYVDQGKLAGLTTLVARDGKVVQFEAYGNADIDGGVPMAKDTVFRIYSMTKPITGVAMMMLWEEGKFELDDPVSKYLPSFRNQKVFAGAGEDGKINTKPLAREATIRDLMRHTSGLTYGFFGDTPVDRAYRASGMLDPEHNLKTFTEALGKQPLLYQPGEGWVYSLSVDVQGRLVEVLSGMKLDDFFQKRIFEPLGMVDTGFYVREDQKPRFAEIYGIDKETGLSAYRGDFYQDFTVEPKLLSGGGGLVSTTLDYFRFTQMIANGGELDGVRLLKKDTVELMAKDHLPEKLNGIAGGQQGLGFGLNFAVVTDLSKNVGSVSKGEYFWGGMANTLFWIDPETEVVALLMTNILPSGVFNLRGDMRTQVYAAMAE